MRTYLLSMKTTHPPLYKLKISQFSLGRPKAREAIKSEIHDYSSYIDSSAFYESHMFGYQVYKLKILQSVIGKPKLVKPQKSKFTTIVATQTRPLSMKVTHPTADFTS